MKRLTTDAPKDNLEAALNLFYIKDYETWVRGYGPAPEYADVSLFDLTRDIVKTHIPDAELPADNDNLSNMMAEWLMDGIDSAEGVVALLYTAAWAYAELRHKLMRYEDTGLEPEQILELKSFTQGGVHKADEGWLHVQNLLQAEKDGRLVVLPCKVGDSVYIPDLEKKIPVKVRVQGISISVSGRTILRFGGYPAESAWGDGCGKDWFLNREDAEAALSLKGENT